MITIKDLETMQEEVEHKPFPCPHSACPKGYSKKRGLLWHLQTKLHCQQECCVGCDEADQLLREKRQRLETQQEAQQQLEARQRTKHAQIDEWLMAIREELLKQDKRHTDPKTYVEWEEDKAAAVKIVCTTCTNKSKDT